MQQTFRPRVYVRNVGIVGLLFFGGMMIACAAGAFFNSEHAVVYLAIASFWGVWSLLAIYLLIAYFVARWDFHGVQVRDRGVFIQRELLLDNSTHIKWRTWPVGGSIILRSPLARISIGLEVLQHDKRLAIIEYLREAVPLDQQAGWGMFCHRWALPLRGESNTQRTDNLKTDDDYENMTKTQLDRLFVWMLIPMAIVVAGVTWLAGSHACLGPVGMFVLLWIVLRLCLSKGGIQSANFSAASGPKGMLAEIVALVAIMVGIAVVKAVGIDPFWMHVALWVFILAGLASFYRSANRDHRRRREDVLGESADERWREALDEPPAT